MKTEKNQTNNNEKDYLDVDELFTIASRLKKWKDEKNGTKRILEKNPSSIIRERYDNAKIEYNKALQDFHYFIEKYIYLYPDSVSPIIFTEDGTCKVISKDNHITEIQKDRLLAIIQKEIDKELNTYFKVKEED